MRGRGSWRDQSGRVRFSRTFARRPAADLLLSLCCELPPIIRPLEPKGLAFSILVHVSQSAARFGFETQLCWVVIGHGRTVAKIRGHRKGPEGSHGF